MPRKIYCVYSHNKLDFKKYVKSANYDDVISFHDIITKLVKNDVNSNKPSTFIINSYIRKRLIRAINNESAVILYAIKSIDIDTILHIKELVQQLSEFDYKYELVVVNKHKMKFELTEDFSSQFLGIKDVTI
tara:strand:- start:2167 stop:2562 length:396 start_codon:yes stop_codon:yes gene_type:complete